jgi:pyruvate/2-oxoacid:ferredoxin oxidoreductase beta subunit
MSAANRYVLTKKLKKILEARGIVFVCKHCDCPIQVDEEVESKQQNNRHSQIYHATCYDNSFIGDEN